MQASGRNPTGEWSYHVGSRIYRVKSARKYLALLEGAYVHPTRRNYWDSRNRFYFGMTADRLEGPWTRVEDNPGEFLAEAGALRESDGSPSPLDQVSHCELVRAGNNQRMEIEDFRLQLVFQAFDAEGVPPNYDYQTLPWRLWLARNF